MRYSQDEVIELMDRVEEQGGEHLDDQCTARRYSFVGDKMKPVTLPGCGNSLLFDVPYTGENEKQESVVVCAVDDDMGKWPRFGGDRFASMGEDE
jgi:hypothetical protein